MRVLRKIAPAPQVVSVGASAPAPLSLFFFWLLALSWAAINRQPSASRQSPTDCSPTCATAGRQPLQATRRVMPDGLLAWQALATCQQAMPERTASRFWRWPSIHRCRPPAGWFCPRVRARRERQCCRIRPERTKTPAAAFLMAGRYKLTGEPKKSR